jgi:hypothetical protein
MRNFTFKKHLVVYSFTNLHLISHKFFFSLNVVNRKSEIGEMLSKTREEFTIKRFLIYLKKKKFFIKINPVIIFKVFFIKTEVKRQ